ncbi:MAG TPA: hypothetical protein VHD32_14170 [Candidatus Didemnitutus sp.]|nr:hypothetical protein [Candidatus Didemnitutus sp.]
MKKSVLVYAALAVVGVLFGAPPRPVPPSEAHQFDFWLGEWSVTEAGKPAGSSRIQSIAGGNALLENWEDVDGGSGKSLNTYNAKRKQWQQFWVDSSGGVLELSGGIVGRSMVLSNETTGRDGRPLRNRITWTPNDDGSVRQLWETSRDDGRTWQTSFDGLYRRRPRPTSARSPFRSDRPPPDYSDTRCPAAFNTAIAASTCALFTST